MPFLDRIRSLIKGGEPDVPVWQAEVTIGDEFKKWSTSDVGRYIIGRAEQYHVSVLKELGEADPSDKQRIMQLQTEARMPGKLLQWIEDAIMQGERAKFDLSQFEDSDY